MAQTATVSVLAAGWIDDLKFLALMPILIRLWELLQNFEDQKNSK